MSIGKDMLDEREAFSLKNSSENEFSEGYPSKEATRLYLKGLRKQSGKKHRCLSQDLCKLGA